MSSSDADRYTDKIVPIPLGAEPVEESLCSEWQIALLCIDLQYLGCTEGYGVFESHRRSGVSDDAIRYYLNKVHEQVVPNVNNLQNFFRKHGFEVIHIHIQSLTRDGRDRSREHKELGLHAPRGSRLAEFLPDVKPLDDEIVLNKTASGVFISTNLEYILRNLCISELFVTGVYTNECVSSAVRSASDLGFKVTLISDATAALSDELHEATLITTRDRYAQVMTSKEVMKNLTNRKSRTTSRPDQYSTEN